MKVKHLISILERENGDSELQFGMFNQNSVLFDLKAIEYRSSLHSPGYDYFPTVKILLEKLIIRNKSR